MENKYAMEIEEILQITPQIDECNNFFHKFIEEKEVDISKEINFLSEIKRFLILKEKDIRKINSKSKIRNYDCLTLAIIACLVASRNHFYIKIGRPELISRYYHTVLITSENKMFKLTGKRKNYGFKELKVDTIIKRLHTWNPLFSFLDKIFKKT